MKMALCCDCVLWLCIFVTSLVTSTTTNAYNCGNIVSNSSGYTIPSGDIIIEYGKPLDIYCVLNEDFVRNNGPNSSSRLSFVRGNDPLPSEMIDIINSSTIRLHIDKPPLSHVWHTCVLDGKEAVCGSIVFVGTKPKDVENFKCASNNYENLTCSWIAPENYVKTSYKLTYHLSGRAGRRHSYGCPVSPKADENGRMNCFWNVSTTPQYRQAHEEFFFNLTMNNTFGSNSMTIVFNNFQHMYPGPPEDLRVLNHTSSSIFLQWKIPSALEHFPPGLHHRILYQCEYGPKDVWNLADILCLHTVCGNSKEMYFNLSGLPHAHALCDIRVSLRSARASPDDESMWSANASITARVGSTVPGAPPKTTAGSFETVSSSNNVYVYWQQIPEEIRNGPHFRYNISVDGEPNIRPIEITNAYANFVNLSVTRSYTIRIWSENSVGPSKQTSIVNIPRQSERLKEPSGFTKIEFGGGKYELNWEAPKDISKMIVTNYTLFWCNHKKDRPFRCNGFLNWIIIPGSVTSKEIYVPEQENYHQFAISAISLTSSSGMLWATCTVIHSEHIGKMKNVQINGVGSTYIDVGWKLECSDQIGSVRGFIIYYCAIGSDPTRQNCEGPQRNVTFYGDQSLSHGNVTGLAPYTTYRLTVSVLSKNNRLSQESDVLRNTTLESAPSTPPLDVIITNITNTTMVIEWKPPKATNGILKYYEIHYNNEKRKITDPKARSYILNNLTSFVDYNISVVACTVACSEPSPAISRHTLMGYPGRIVEPRINVLNESHIQIKWDKPEKPGGKNDFYELLFKEKSEHENKTIKMFNVTGTIHTVDYCGDEQKHDRIYISVRAVNMIEGKRYEGPWSQESIAYCSGQQTYWMWFVFPVVIVAIIGLLIFCKKMYDRYEMMKVVEIVLPQGLGGDVATLKNTDWTQKRPEPDHHPPADEELLLEKVGESRHQSGDSSGCVSGHESVTSCAESVSHISSASDSGTEQPRTPSTGELRQRTTRNTMPKDYVLMPTETSGSASWSGKGPTSSDYCILGVDPASANTGQSEQSIPYIACDSGAPYVMTGDMPKVPSPGYVPFNAAEPAEKNTGYVVAGNKSMLIPDLLPRELVPEKSSYVQVATTGPGVPWTPQSAAEGSTSKTGYVSIGEASAVRGIPEASKGYVPHRHFDGKSIKED